MSEFVGTSQPFGPTVNQSSPSLPSTLGDTAQSGIPQFLSLISVDGNNPWILDSRATII